MHSRNTTAADALHQAAVNVKNTNNLPTDLRHAQLQPSGTSSSTTGMGTSGTSSGPVFHEQPRETMTSGASSHTTTTTTGTSHLPRAMDKDRDGRLDMLERDRNHDGIADRNQNVGTTGTGTTGMGMGQTKTTMTVESVTRDAQAQIDAQVAEALAKSRQLNAQDQARLQSSIGSATASLEEQARQLKAQIDQEKLRAEQHVKHAQQEKLSATAERQAMEEKAIMEAAAARKIELEQKAMKLQKEIEEITRQKTAEMMAEKPGNLQFVHQHQDTAVKAQLAGDIGHALDIAQSGRVTETTTGGDVQYHPVKVQTTESTSTQQARAAEKTVQGPEVHQRQGGILHAMKTLITGQHDEPTSSSTSTTTTSTTTKTAPVTGKTYDEQSQWANQSDKLSTAK